LNGKPVKKLLSGCKNGFISAGWASWHVIRSLLLAYGAIAPKSITHLIKTK